LKVMSDTRRTAPILRNWLTLSMEDFICHRGSRWCGYLSGSNRTRFDMVLEDQGEGVSEFVIC
jgi:hypothetical protein